MIENNKINTMKIRGQVIIIREVITKIEEEIIEQESMVIMKAEVVVNVLEAITNIEDEKIIEQESMFIMMREVAKGLEAITNAEEDIIISQKIERTEVITNREVDRTLQNFKIMMIIEKIRGLILNIDKTKIMMEAEEKISNTEVKELEPEVTQEVREGTPQELRQEDTLEEEDDNKNK